MNYFLAILVSLNLFFINQVLAKDDFIDDAEVVDIEKNANQLDDVENDSEITKNFSKDKKNKSKKDNRPGKKKIEQDVELDLFISGDILALVNHEYGKLVNAVLVDRSFGVRLQNWEFSVRLFNMNSENNVNISDFGEYVLFGKYVYNSVRFAYLLRPKFRIGLGIGRFSTQYSIVHGSETILKTTESIDNRAIELFLKYTFRWRSIYIEPEFIKTGARVAISGGINANLDMQVTTADPPDRIGLNLGFEF